MKKQTILASVAVLLLIAGSCKKEEHEGELITTVKLELKEKKSGITQTFIWEDADGPGGNNPNRTDTIRMADSSEYEVSTQFLSNGTDITAEIKNEAAEHLVCYTGPGASVLNIGYADTDGKYPLGLSTNWITLTSGSGVVRVNLRHQPGSKNGNCDVGESDVDINFEIVIK